MPVSEGHSCLLWQGIIHNVCLAYRLPPLLETIKESSLVADGNK